MSNTTVLLVYHVSMPVSWVSEFSHFTSTVSTMIIGCEKPATPNADVGGIRSTVVARWTAGY